MNIAVAVNAYIECALWAGLDWTREDESGNLPTLDENYDYTCLSLEARGEIISELIAFMADNESDLEGMEDEQIGHDFYLTRNGHGAGFWDRGLGERGERLSAAARVYGTSELYPGDDGLLYLSQ